MESIKTIVILMDDRDGCAQRLELAIGLAQGFDACLLGVYLTSDPMVSPTVAALLPDDIMAAHLRRTGSAQTGAESLFRNLAAAAGLTAIEWRAPADEAVAAAVAHARCADWVVLGQPNPEDADAGFERHLVQNVVFSGARPVLMVPYVGASAAFPHNILVAWDGGREASRAIADALPLLVRAERVTVVSIRTDATREVMDAQAEARLADYLRAHGIEAELKHYEGSASDVGEVLISSVADFGCSMMVMGGYGHARIREWALGGTTRTVMESMTVPVLMSH